MRRTWVLAFCVVIVLCSAGLMTQTGNTKGDASTQRNVLFELFTSTWCSGCPYADAAADNLKAEYGERISVLQYHVQEEGITEPFYDTPETNARSVEYGVPNLPLLWVDGIESREGASSENDAYSKYKAVLDSRLTVDSPLQLRITNASLGIGKITVKVDLSATDSLQQTSFNLRFVTYENKVVDDTTIYNYVVRDIEVKSVSAASLPVSLSQDLAYNATWNYDNMGAVVFAQVGDAGEVLQSHSMGFGIEDEDNDGLPDEWEMLKLGTLLYSGEDDPDGDEITNLEEYMNHTDPLVKNSKDGVDVSIYIWLAVAAVVIILIVTLIVAYMMGRTREQPEETQETAGEEYRETEAEQEGEPEETDEGEEDLES